MEFVTSTLNWWRIESPKWMQLCTTTFGVLDRNIFNSVDRNYFCNYSTPPDPLAEFKGPTSKKREGRAGEGGKGKGGHPLVLAYTP